MRAYAAELLCREVFKERGNFFCPDDHQPVRLLPIACQLGQELIGGYADGAGEAQEEMQEEMQGRFPYSDMLTSAFLLTTVSH